jgi:hypothetical protein
LAAAQDVDHPRRGGELGLPALGLVVPPERFVTVEYLELRGREQPQIILV